MIAKHIQNIPPSGIREFFDLVLGMPQVISLGVGEPDFVTPWRIREKAISALEEGYTSYTSNKGLAVLRKNISQHLYRKYGIKYDWENEILITTGVSEGLDLALRAVLNPNDKVVIPSPYYVAYPALARLCLARPLFLPSRQEEGFKINLEKLSLILAKKPKVLILNYPANPTGITYSLAELKALAKLLAKTQALVISDEIYSELVYEGEHIPFSAFRNTKNKTVLLGGFSKNYAMTGFRVGYACGPKEVIAAMTKIHAYSALCAPIMAQIAAQDALKDNADLQLMRREYRRRRDYIVEELNRIGLKTVMPQGAFYCFSDISIASKNSLSFARSLLFSQKVAVVPGEAFGREYSHFVRISYANSLENLKEAVERIKKFIRQPA